MTDYIDKMMETAGVEQEEEKYCYWECKNPELRNIACNNTQCTHYRHVIHPYPDFTAEKQLELIKLIATIKGFAGMGEILDWYTEFDALSLEEGIAKIITYQITSGKLDKEKIKEILEC